MLAYNFLVFNYFPARFWVHNTHTTYLPTYLSTSFSHIIHNSSSGKYFSVFTYSFFVFYIRPHLTVSKRLNTLSSWDCWIIKTLLLYCKFAQYDDAYCLLAECYFPSCLQKIPFFSLFCFYFFSTSRAGVYYRFVQKKKKLHKKVFLNTWKRGTLLKCIYMYTQYITSCSSENFKRKIYTKARKK